MTLVAGERLGSYEIVAPLGAGGMGEVYRARDLKLERDVALKVLPPQLSENPEALARFGREARAVAALSHPNILSIFDFGEAGGRAYAVMELLEGATLRERLADGAIGAKKALEIAAQIAQGLAAAHERGVVHRDLKPENIFVVRDGRVKILDFGLAKQQEAAGSLTELRAARTVDPGTQPGTVMGTVGYMAPEQVKGLPADARADIFALGLTLYEMLTGRRAFSKDSSVETMSAILKEEPAELEALAAKLPPALDRILRHCLEKNPEERFQSARDLAFALNAVSGGSSTTSAGGAAVLPGRGPARRWLPLAAAALAGIALGWLGARGTSPLPAVAKPLRPEFRQLTKQPGAEYGPALSPDGESLVYERLIDGQRDLFLQRVDGQTSIPLTADCDQEDREPAFSPDGKLIAYHSDCQGGGLFVMGATGENLRKVADFGYAPSWSPDGREIAVSTTTTAVPWNRPNASELWAVSVESGAKRLVSRADAFNPSWSPHGQRIAFWGLPADSFSRDLWTAAADGSEPTVEKNVRLTDDAEFDWNPVWSADGRWLYFASFRGGTLNFWRMPVDEKSGRSLGEPEPVTAPSGAAGWLAASRDGRRFAFVDRNARTSISRVPIDARSGALAGPAELLYQGSIEAFDAELSPGGDALLISSTDQPQHLYLLKADGSSFRQLTEGPFRDRQATWSPDGKWIAFQTSRNAGGLAMIRPDGGGLREVVRGVSRLGEPLFSPDGRTLATFGAPGYLVDLSGEMPVEPETALAPDLEGSVFNPTSFSPNGRELAGMVIKEGATEGVGIYDMEAGRWEILPERGALYPILLNDQGLMYWLNRGSIELRDRSGRLLRTLVTLPQGHRLDYIGVTLDRRWLTWIDATDESDIWLMTLEGPKPAGAAARP